MRVEVSLADWRAVLSAEEREPELGLRGQSLG